jgi:ABC-type transport system involved in multi-copper enzyme maturation permease subunit/uncharacterized RDD family membrane protein YckC
LLAYASEGRRYGGIAQQAQYQAELGMLFFFAFSMFCVGTMGLIPPVLTSTSIGSEKLGKTLPVLMMTPISTWQIVTGKLLSRLLAALTLMGLSLPVLALVRLLGGVELEQMVAVLCLCTSFAISSAAIGLLFSTFINRAYAVILLAYATQLFLYLFVPMIVAMCFQRNRTAGMAALSIMFGSHPVVAVFAMSFPEAGRLPVTVHWGICSIVQVALAVFLLTLSGLALRRVARREGERATGLPPEAYDPLPVASVAPPLLPRPLAASRSGSGDPRTAGESTLPVVGTAPGWEVLSGREVLPNCEAASGVESDGGSPPRPPPLSAPPVVPYRLPATRGKTAREVSDNPILWREVRRPLLARLWMRVTATIACIVLLLITYAAMGASDVFDSTRHYEQVGFSIVFSGLFWLLTAVLSATAIASEKESDTWTLLLTTPVSGSAVVWGKVAGLLRRLIWPTVLVAAHFILFTLIGHVPVVTTAFVLFVMVTFNSIWIATGLYLSLRMRRVTFAVITNLMLAVAAYAVVPAVLYVFSQLVDPNNDRWVEYGIWHLPYSYLGNFLEGYFRSDSDYYRGESYWLPVVHHVSQQTFLLVTVSVGCIHLLVSWLILRRTAIAFDAIVGRAGKEVHGAEFDPDDVVLLSGSTAYAAFWRRAVAFLIDTGIVQLGCGAIGLLIGVGALLVADQSDESPGIVLARYAALGSLASVVVGWLYYALFETSRRRASPGKSLMRVFVTDGDGRRVSFGRASGRYWSKVLSGVLLGFGYLIAPFSPQMRTMHDRFADTLVLKR